MDLYVFQWDNLLLSSTMTHLQAYYCNYTAVLLLTFMKSCLDNCDTVKLAEKVNVGYSKKNNTKY